MSNLWLTFATCFFLVACNLPVALGDYQTITIDSFITEQYPVKVTGPSIPAVGIVNGNGLLGGARVLEMQSNLGTISGSVSAGILGISAVGVPSGPNTYSFQQSATLIYDGGWFPLNTSGLGKVDLAQNYGWFRIGFGNNDLLPLFGNFSASFVVNSGGVNCTRYFDPCSTYSEFCFITLPIADFQEQGCDMSRVGAISITFPFFANWKYQ